MLGLRFLRLPRHRKFSYQPMYYNEQKEQLQDQVKRIKQEMGEEKTSVDDVKDNIRAAFRKEPAMRYSKSPWEKFYSLRIIFLAVIIGFVVMYIMSSNWMLELIEGLGG